MTAGSVYRPALCMLIISISSPTASIAQTSDHKLEDIPEYYMDAQVYETVVTATKVNELRFDAPRSIEKIDKQTAERAGARSVPEAIADSPGVLVQKTNRGSGSPIIRGLIGPQNLIVVDGVRFNTSTFRTGPNQYLSTFDNASVDSIEIVRGPSSVLYGNGAMGGVLHLLTSKPTIDGTTGWNGRISSWFSSADASPGGDFQLVSKAEELTMLGGASFTHHGNLRSGHGEIQPLSSFDSGSWRAKAILDLTSRIQIQAAHFGGTLNDAGRTDQIGKGDVRLYSNRDHLTYLSTEYTGRELLDKIKATLSFHRLEESVHRFGCRKDDDGTVSSLSNCSTLKQSTLTRKRRYRDQVSALGMDLESSWLLFNERVQVNAGSDFYQDFVSSSLHDARADLGFAFSESERGNFSEDSRYRTFGIFLHTDAVLVEFPKKAGELHVSAGGRFAHFGAYAPDVPSIGDVEYDHNGFAGTAGIQWLASDSFNVYLSAAQGFRAPNLQETTVLGDTGNNFEIPSDTLRPERSDTLELGTKLKFKHFDIAAAGFRSALQDVIVRQDAEWNGQTEIDGKPVIKRTNASSGLYYGLEGAISIFLWRFRLDANGTWMRGDIENSDGTIEPARRVPPLFGRAGISYRSAANDKYYAEVYTRFAAAQDRLSPGDKKDLRMCETSQHSGELKNICKGTPGWVTLNARAGIRWTEHLRLETAVSNLTDVRYKEHGSGYDAAGIDARGSLIAEF